MEQLAGSGNWLSVWDLALHWWLAKDFVRQLCIEVQMEGEERGPRIATVNCAEVSEQND